MLRDSLVPAIFPFLTRIAEFRCASGCECLPPKGLSTREIAFLPCAYGPSRSREKLRKTALEGTSENMVGTGRFELPTPRTPS